MASINVQMGVSGVSQFVNSIKQSEASVKTLDAALKLNEKQFKATGDKETYMAQKTDLLKKQIEAQRKAVDQAQAALKKMTAQGVDPSSRSFQQMQQKADLASASLAGMQLELGQVGKEAENASKGTDKLTSGINGISKKISLDQVISGIGSITKAMESAAQKAVKLGETIWNNVMSSAKWADDTATMALMYGIDIDTFQRMQKLVQNGMDTSVEAILRSQQKLTKGVGSGSSETLEALKSLGIGLRAGTLTDPFGWRQKDPADLFWEAGRAIMDMSDAYEQEAKAQALFGRSWKELIPLFDTEHGGFANKEEYEAALAEINVLSEQQVDDLALLNDKVAELKSNYDTLKNDVMASLAPALTKAADALSGLLNSVLEYLRTPEGQQALDDMSTAVSGLFDDLGSIDPEQVVSGFKQVFGEIVDGLKWMVDNQGTLKGLLVGIVTAWGAAKLTGGALKVLELINGFKGLVGGGEAATGAASGGSAVSTVSKWAALKGLGSTIKAAAPIAAGSAAVIAAAVGPAAIAQKHDEAVWIAKQNRLLDATERIAQTNAANAAFVQQAAIALGPKRKKNGDYVMDATGLFLNMAPTTQRDDLLMGLQGRKNQQQAELFNTLTQYAPYTAGNYTVDLLQHYWKTQDLDPVVVTELLQNVTDAMAKAAETEDNRVQVPMAPDMVEDAPEEIIAQIEEAAGGTLTIPAKIQVTGLAGGGFASGVGFRYLEDLIKGDMRGHANGLSFVPWDGYPAILHKGERVLTAGMNRTYTANSHLYVENMNMNNGTDVQALADAMAANSRRISAGFGS